MSDKPHITEALYLTLPVDRQDGKTIWIHAQAINKAAFERYWFVLSKTFAAIYGEGLGVLAGPRVASRMLKRIAIAEGEWDGPTGIEHGLLPEIRRLCNVLVPGAGWDIVPFEDAIKKQTIDAEDADEIESVLVFFTVAWHLHRRGAERQAVMAHVLSRLAASMKSLRLSEFQRSLPTSTETASTGETDRVTSLRPSSIGAPVPVSRPASGSATAISPGVPRTNTGSAT